MALLVVDSLALGRRDECQLTQVGHGRGRGAGRVECHGELLALLGSCDGRCRVRQRERTRDVSRKLSRDNVRLNYREIIEIMPARDDNKRRWATCSYGS